MQNDEEHTAHPTVTDEHGVHVPLTTTPVKHETAFPLESTAVPAGWTHAPVASSMNPAGTSQIKHAPAVHTTQLVSVQVEHSVSPDAGKCAPSPHAWQTPLR